MPFYAVRRGKVPGVYSTWKECQQQTVGFTGAQFKKFDSEEEAEMFVKETKAGQSKQTGQGSSKKRTIDKVDEHGSNEQTGDTETGAGKKRATKIQSDSGSKEMRDQVFVEGLCTFQGKKGQIASVGIVWPELPKQNKEIKLELEGKLSKNRADIHAAIEAIKLAKVLGKSRLLIKSSSSNLVQSAGQWMQKWQENDWKTKAGTDVANKEDWMLLNELCSDLDISWELTGSEDEAHREMAIELAKSGAKK